MGKIKINKWSTSEEKIIILQPSIFVSGDMKFSKLMMYICFRIKAAVEAMFEVEVKNFHESNLRR